MVGSIAVGLGIHNIIFHFQYRDVALLGNQVGNPVNIVCKRADNADSGDIIYIFPLWRIFFAMLCADLMREVICSIGLY